MNSKRTIYWPVVCLFMLLFSKGIPGFTFSRFTSDTILLLCFTFYGLWGIWFIYKNRKKLTDEQTDISDV
jgi:hypothetical protein